jgi:hypothetical protein
MGLFRGEQSASYREPHIDLTSSANSCRRGNVFMTTACSATNPEMPLGSGKQNLATPKPIMPPNTPTDTPVVNAQGADRGTACVPIAAAIAETPM